MNTATLPMEMNGVIQRPDWQTRLIMERYDLSEKLNGLLRALAMGVTPESARSMLMKQAKAMKRYLWCLDQRIAQFMPPKS